MDDPAMRRPGMAGRGGREPDILRTKKKEEVRPAGRLEYTDGKTRRYVYAFSLHTVMDWRKLGVLIARICEAPGFDGKVETVLWHRVEDVQSDLDVPLVDVQMSGLISVSWEPEPERAAKARTATTSTRGMQPRGNRER